MKPRRNGLLVSLLIVVVGVVAAFVFVIDPIQRAWAHARDLSDALTGARSVTLVEFHRDMFGPELVFARLPASPQQIADLRAAMGAWFAPIPDRKMLCFDPHHRVEIVRADGSLLRFEVCFQCENFKLDGSHATTMPLSWRNRLAQFFTSAGMPPREDYSALAKSHPDYHLVEKAQREFKQRIEHAAPTPQK